MLKTIVGNRRAYRCNKSTALIVAVVISVLASTVPGHAGINEWVTNGPSGTIVYSLELAPNYSSSKTVFAGTDGGAYKTSNSGTSWVQSGLSSNHIFALAVSPSYASDSAIFAGTASAGVYKSANGGSSWTQSGLAGTSISALTVSPNFAVDSTVFAGTNGGVYKSTDSGASWVQINTGLNHTYVSALAVSPGYASDNTAFVGTSDGGGVYKSSNGGASWVQSGLPGTNTFSLAISPNYAVDRTIIAGTYGDGVYISTNDGADWTQTNTDLTQTNVPSIGLSPQYASDYTVFGGTWGGGVFSCTTSDNSPPLISTIDPVHGTADIARDKTVTITFDEKIQSGVAYNLVTLKDAANNQIAMTKAINGRVLTLDPVSDLAYGTVFTVIIPAGAVKDTANNAFAAQYTSSFTTLTAPDTTAPTVSTADPANSATGVLRDKTVTVTFNENIQAGSAYDNITFKTGTGASVTVTKSISGATLSLDPASDLASNTTYSIVIPASAVKDMANNALAAQYTLSFTTQNDTTPPTVGSTDPANNAVDIIKEKTMTLTFSENIQTGTAYETISVKDSSSTAVALTKSIKDKVLTLDPTGNLALGTKFTVTIPASAIKDSAGNALAAQYTFSFTTQSDTSTASAPQALTLVGNKGMSHMSWTVVTGNDLAGYNVYRKVKGDSAFGKINASTVTEAQYKDTYVEVGKTYVYVVTWVDKAGKESAKSTELEVLIEKANESGYADVADTAWYKDYVIQLTTNKIISGYVDGTFRPNHDITRAEFAKMVCIAMGWTLENPSSASFSDVAKDHWAYKYIETAKSKGVIGGYEDATFKPGKNITRAEITKIVAETLSLPAGASTLTDVAKSWAKDYIDKCVKAGIVSGYNDNTFRPNNTATRAEAAKMVVGVLNAKE